jgi:hypothetical protein
MACLRAAWKAELLGCEKNEHRLTSAPPPHFQVNRLKGMIESQDKKSFKSDSDSHSTGNSAKKSQSRWDSPPSRSAPQPASCAAQPFAIPISFSSLFCHRLARTPLRLALLLPGNMTGCRRGFAPPFAVH